MTIVPAVVQWESSERRMRAHRVNLFLDAARLGAVRSAPSVEDALRAAVAAALSSEPSETLAELVLRFSSPPSSSAYRSGPTRATGIAETLGRALLEYLHASGNDALARALGEVELTMSGDGGGGPELRVDWPRSQGGRQKTDVETIAIVTRALRDLLGEGRTRIVVG
jgi:hypothetical protein